MGAAGSSIKNYQLGQPYYSNIDASLKVTVCPATNIIDGQKYTVFQFAKENGRLSEPTEKYIEVLKTTRHPYILKFLALFSDTLNETLVTEHVIPLDVAVEKQEKEEIYAGLRNVLEALLFLHERSFICHNGVSVSSIFVSDNGEWKLSSFENSSKVLRLSKQSFNNDISGFAEFTLSVLEYLKDDSEITGAFTKRLEKELAVENKEVSTLRAILEDPFFKFPYLEALDGVQKLPLKSNEDKIELFRDLHDVLQGLPPYVVCRRFIPILFSHMVITDPVANELFMQHLFASGNDYCVDNGMQPLFDKDHFIKYSLPKILNLYELRDVTVRLTLMKHLPMYVDCIDKDILQDEILPEILVGLKDTDDKIVQETFLALASIVSMLGGNVVVGGESNTYFYDRKPDFSRSDATGKGNPLSKKVLDILKAKKPTNATEKMIEERKQKRFQREKQREEQRKIREERKQEREAARIQREQKVANEEGIDYEANHIPNLADDPENSFETSAHIEGPDNLNHSDENDSEAEWEGFEVQSNSSDQEVNDSSYKSDLTSPVTGYNGNEVDNDLELPPLGNKNKLKTSSTKSVASSSNSKHELPFKEVNNETREFINSKVTPAMNGSQNKKTSVSTKHDLPKGQPTKTKGIPISNIKPTKHQNKEDETNKLTNKSNKEDETNKVINKSNKTATELGIEFDIKLSKNKFTTEPDYFADMAPSIGDKSSSTVYIKEQTGVSSKFNMDLSLEESTGWEDDGWGNDEEIV